MKKDKRQTCHVAVELKASDCTYMVLATLVHYVHVGSCLNCSFDSEEGGKTSWFVVHFLSKRSKYGGEWKTGAVCLEMSSSCCAGADFYLGRISSLTVAPCRWWAEIEQFHVMTFKYPPKKTQNLSVIFSLHPPDGLAPSLGHLTCPAHPHTSPPASHFPMSHFRQSSYLVSSPSSVRCEAFKSFKSPHGDTDGALSPHIMTLKGASWCVLN